MLAQPAEVPTEDVNVTVGTLPTVTSQPKGDTICAGAGFTLSSAATGTNVRFQWLKGTTPIPTATSASYTVASASIVDGGTYTVQVSNECGNIVSQTAEVIVNRLAEISQQPASVSVGLFDEIRFSVVVSATRNFYLPMVQERQRNCRCKHKQPIQLRVQNAAILDRTNV